MKKERDPVSPAELNALTDKLIQLAADHEKAKAKDASGRSSEVKKDHKTDDQ